MLLAGSADRRSLELFDQISESRYWARDSSGRNPGTQQLFDQVMAIRDPDERALLLPHAGNTLQSLTPEQRWQLVEAALRLPTASMRRGAVQQFILPLQMSTGKELQRVAEYLTPQQIEQIPQRERTRQLFRSFINPHRQAELTKLGTAIVLEDPEGAKQLSLI